MNASETVTIAALMGFDTYPVRDNDPAWLYRNCDAASFALAIDDLPYGGWTSQGYAFERAAMASGHGRQPRSLVRDQEFWPPSGIGQP